jgi:hypothetical protein
MLMECDNSFAVQRRDEDVPWPPPTASPQVDHAGVDHWSRTAMGWARSALGGDLLSAVLHLDDLGPHIHLVARASVRSARDYRQGYLRHMFDSGLVRPPVGPGAPGAEGLNGEGSRQVGERITVRASSSPAPASDPFGENSPAPFGEAEASSAREFGEWPAPSEEIRRAKLDRLNLVNQDLVDLKIETLAAMRNAAPAVPPKPLGWLTATFEASPVKPLSPSAAWAVSLPGGELIEGSEDGWRAGDVSGQGVLELANHLLGRGPEAEASTVRELFAPLGEVELFRHLGRERAVTIRRRGRAQGATLSPKGAPAPRSVRPSGGAGTLGGGSAQGRGPEAAKRAGLPPTLPPEMRANLRCLPYALSEVLNRLGFNAEESRRVWTEVRHRVPGPIPSEPRDRPEAESPSPRGSIRR